MDISLEETKDKLIKKKRHHILKRIKKHFGIARRDTNSCPGQNNLPPLQFHVVHGDNIRISRDGTLARRFESFCRALTFSARPVRINERICMRFSEVSNNWNGGIRFGFTSNDPSTLENALPKYACPDLTNRPGFWAKALHEQYCELDNILHYHVNSAGDVIYGINGEEKGIILSGIDVRGLLWTIIDIYGNCTAIELLDARLFNHQSPTIVYANQRSLSNNSVNCIVTPLQSLSMLDEETILPQLNYYISNRLNPMPFHTTKGRNVSLTSDRLIATRTDTDFCQGYVFTSRPIQPNENIVIQILKTDSTYVGALALGLTSCNPSSLSQYDLPDDSNFLLDRPEYWVVSKDVALQCDKGDEISFCISSIGEVTISKNRGVPVVVMHVDHRLRLWVFLDVYGTTQSIRIFRESSQHTSKSIVPLQANLTTSAHSIKENTTASNSANTLSSHASSSAIHPLSSSTSTASINVNDIISSSSMFGNLDSSINSTALAGSFSIPKVGQIIVPSSSEMIQIQPGGTVLVVNLPPPTSCTEDFDHKSEIVRKTNQIAPTFSSSPSVSTYKNQSIEHNSLLSNKNNQSKPKNEAKSSEKESAGSECTICYEKNIDSVLYMCGHMCMCYECAIEQWRGAGGGQCPLCRAVIRDVIRTYTT